MWYVSGSSIAESNRQTTPASSGQNIPETSRHNNNADDLAGENRRLKALLDVTTTENTRLQALLDTTADDNARLSRVASNMKSALDAYRGKVEKLVIMHPLL